jgi:hypothetical protein
MPHCHARLAKWTTRSAIGTGNRYALKAYVCENHADSILCKACANRTRDHSKHRMRIHGLLTEPIPDDSHIYGSAWYKKQVEKYGEPPEEWIASAKEHQAVAEAWVSDAWTVKLEETVSSRMPKTAKAKANPVKPNPFPKQAFLMYKESDTPILKVATDSYTLEKGEYNGVPVWILPNGKRFDMDEKGEPRNLLG